MNYCSKCGSGITPGAKFCGVCGTPTNIPQNNQQQVPNNYQTANYPNQNGNLNVGDTNTQQQTINQTYQQPNNFVNAPSQVSTSKKDSSKVNKNAIGSIVCSVVSIFIFWWLAVAGVGLALNALREIKNTGEKGKVLAIIGLIISACGLILYWGITGF